MNSNLVIDGIIEFGTGTSSQISDVDFVRSMEGITSRHFNEIGLSETEAQNATVAISNEDLSVTRMAFDIIGRDCSLYNDAEELFQGIINSIHLNGKKATLTIIS